MKPISKALVIVAGCLSPIVGVAQIVTVSSHADLQSCCHNKIQPESTYVRKDPMLKDDKGKRASSSDDVKSIMGSSQLKIVFDSYFAMKDALVGDDASRAATEAEKMVAALNSVDTTKLASDQAIVWTKIIKDLLANGKAVSSTTDIASQRASFVLLSKGAYYLVKVIDLGVDVYHQHCPMYNKGEGADWLSKEKAIKNPYFGKKMLGCGSVTETIE